MNTDTRIHFLTNPVAGRSSTLPLLQELCEILAAEGVPHSFHVTSGRGDAAAHVAALEPDAADRLVVLGGDGTLHEVVNGRALPLPWPVGVVPVGTANIVGRETRMPLRRRARALVDGLLQAEPWGVDLMEIRRPNGDVERAIANVSAGPDAEIVHAVACERAGEPATGGYLHWIRPTWDTFRQYRFPHLRVTLDGRCTYRAAACVILNAHNYGGIFSLAPQAAMDSGMLDAVLIRVRTRRDLFRVLAAAFAGRLDRHSDVKVVRGTRIAVTAEDAVTLQSDGEPAGTTDVEVRLLPSALTLLRALKGARVPMDA